MKKYFIEFERMPNNEIIYSVFYAKNLKELEHDRDYNAEYATRFDLNYQAGFELTEDVYEVEDENDYDDGISELPKGAVKAEFNPMSFDFSVKVAAFDLIDEEAKWHPGDALITVDRKSWQVVSEHDSFFGESENSNTIDNINFDGSPMQHFNYENETWYFVKQ